MCIQMKRRGAPIKWNTSELTEIGQTIIIEKANSKSDSEGIRMNGKNNGKKLKINMLVDGGALVELIGFI